MVAPRRGQGNRDISGELAIERWMHLVLQVSRKLHEALEEP